MLVQETIDLIRTRRYNVEWALTEQLERLSRHFDDIEDEYLRERKADIEQVVERVLKALAGASGAPGERRARCLRRDDRGRARHRAGRHDAVQDANVSGFRHGSRRPHVAHGDRRAQPRHSGRGRRAACQRADPPGRPDHRRRRSRHRDRRSRADRARRIFLPAKRKSAGAAQAAAAEVFADANAGRHAHRTVREHRVAGRRARRDRFGRDRRRPVPHRVPVHESQGPDAGGGRAVRGVPSRGRVDERPAGHDPHDRRGRRQAARFDERAATATRPPRTPRLGCERSAGACPSRRCS